MTPLFSEDEIAARVNALAIEIAKHNPKPDIVVPVLIGAFVFAADLMRALARNGLSLAAEFLWMRSYGNNRTGADDITALVGPTDGIRGKTVLLIDGVLDRGSTLVKARELLLKQGAAHIVTAVVIDKLRDDALLQADYAAFSGVSGFIVGYGMDDAAKDRGLPYIGLADG